MIDFKSDFVNGVGTPEYLARLRDEFALAVCVNICFCTDATDEQLNELARGIWRFADVVVEQRTSGDASAGGSQGTIPDADGRMTPVGRVSEA